MDSQWGLMQKREREIKKKNSSLRRNYIRSIIQFTKSLLCKFIV